MKTTKRTAKPAVKATLIVSSGEGWHVEYDREGKDFTAFVDGVGRIGRADKPHEAQELINQYRYNQLAPAAA